MNFAISVLDGQNVVALWIASVFYFYNIHPCCVMRQFIMEWSSSGSPESPALNDSWATALDCPPVV